MIITKRSLFSWILYGHWPLQILLLLVIAASIFFRVIPLELQKRIINTAIALKDAERLLLYCGLYIGAVILFSSLKYAINMLQGYIGQKILVGMRDELYQHILRLPLQFFRETQPGTVMTSLMGELGAVGAFLGNALAIPITSALTLLTFSGYMFFLDPELALISIAVYPIEIILIPLLQKRFNRLNATRVDESRSMSNVINEAISGVHEIQGNASYRLETDKLRIFNNRLFSLAKQMYLYKFGIKFLNNFFQDLGPFLLFLVGGYLTIQGQLTLGALVAFLSAFEKIYDPVKELIAYYEDYQDALVRYRCVMERFDVEPEYELMPTDRPVHQIMGEIEVKDLEYKLDNGVSLFREVSFHICPGEQLALVGFSGSGKSSLALVLGQLYPYHQGQVLLDGHELRHLTKMDVTSNVGFVAQHPFIFNGTVRDNLLYGSRAMLVAEGEGSKRTLPSKEKVIDMLRTVGLAEDVMRFGLNMVIPREQCEPLVKHFISMRQHIRESFGDKLVEAVEIFDVNQFLNYSSIYDNLIFADVHAAEYQPDNLPHNRAFLKFLNDMKLYEPLFQLGLELARTTVNLFKDLGEHECFFSETSPMKSKSFEMYKMKMERYDRSGVGALGRKGRELLLLLALEFVPAKHTIVTIPESLKQNIVKARHRFIQDVIGADLNTCSAPLERQDAKVLQQAERMGFFLHCAAEYMFSHSVFENLVYGNLKSDTSSDAADLMAKITDLLKKEHADEVIDAGLDYEVGSKGDRLSGGQQQKVALARAFLKEPWILIMDEATASLDNASQTLIQRFIETELRGKSTIVAVIHRLDLLPSYDKILVMKSGRVVESGKYEELMEAKGIFYGLVQGK
jgi:ABC-type multidrug transport system fused ATPase/permease subunit